jgi:hypothetical protein
MIVAGVTFGDARFVREHNDGGKNIFEKEQTRKQDIRMAEP